MRVLHILGSDRFSGAENVACQIIGAARRYDDIEMVYSSPSGPIREALEERGVLFAPLNSLNTGELKRVIREHSPDVIHAHDMRATFVAARAAGRIPIVSHIHGNFAGLNKVSPKAIAFRWASGRVKHIYWVSTSSYEGYVFKKGIAKKSSVLYNVIDSRAMYEKMKLDSNEYDFDVIFLGRLCYEKNPERLIRVLKLLVEKKSDVRIAVVGTGELLDGVKALASELGIAGNISFMGFVPNPLKMLYCSKAMVMTSIREGTPMCALEAMACGVPIVSTPTDGMKDVVLDGESGYLSEDDNVLADRLYDIVSNKEVRDALSEKTLLRSSQINDIDKFITEIVEMYRSVVR